MFPRYSLARLLAFSFSLDDTIISSFVSVAGASPWPVYVFSAVRNALRPQVASVSTLLLLVTLFAIGCVAIVLRRERPVRRRRCEDDDGRRLAREPREQQGEGEERHRERHPPERSLRCRAERGRVDRLDVAVLQRDASFDRCDAPAQPPDGCGEHPLRR